MFADFYQTTRCHVQEVCIFHLLLGTLVLTIVADAFFGRLVAYFESLKTFRSHTYR
jgi:hypothetical protein